MSLIRALSKELQARSDDSLRALFAARPDLMSPAVPDFAALAARASGRVSVQRALERLNRPEMQVLETLHLCTNTDTGHSASAATLKRLINGSTATALERLLHSLQELALVHRAEPPHGVTPAAGRQRYYLPVGSLKDVIGIYPAGLGRSYTELVRLQPAFAQRVVQLVGELHHSGADIAPATTPMEAALSLQHWTASPDALQALLATAPERTTALLARFGNWAMGAVPQAQRRASVLNEGSDVGPVDWLLARGLLVPLDAAHVELPHSVGVALRGGFVIEHFALSPPAPRLGLTTAALRRNAALGAIAETLRLAGELLYAVREQPLVTLRSGGVGVREMKRLADALRIGLHEAGVLAELCALAGLLRLDVDSSAWVQAPQLEWLTLPRQEQWLWLVNAWLASERVPSLVGQPVSGVATAQAHRGPAGSTINALSAEAQRPDAPVVRKRILEILNELTVEAAAADGEAPVLDAAAVLERADWSQPRMARRFSSLIQGVLAEAEMLGLVGSGALSQIGAAIAVEQPDQALAILGEHLPAALNHVLLQADLTAVAPGYLDPELSEKLLTMADAEGQGPATIYRFSVASVRRALDAGQDAGALLDFLREHSATAVPQPLQYLIEDTAARHARLRVGPAASFIHSEDETALLELLSTPAASGLGLVRIAPTVLVSHAAPREAAQLLRSLGLSPAVEEADSATVRLRRSTAAPGSARPVYTAPRTAPADADVDAQLAVLRDGGSAPGAAAPGARGAAGASGASGGEAATQLGLETLQKAIRLKQRVVMNVVDSLGNATRETVVPVAVSGGRVRVFDPAKETERVLSIHRIIDVEATEELLQ
ncbi:helicase-associated domain-containing protein [uncultured Arthrobacter sp.]|uniref:helicase-associated domain-containing protein n=1 Tax=uncultured Arthrobacter sp. TaxID=114050 RepID=UPI0032175CD2